VVNLKYLTSIDQLDAPLCQTKGSPRAGGGAGAPARGKTEVDRAERSLPIPARAFSRSLYRKVVAREKKKEELKKAHNKSIGCHFSIYFKF
jgi:hypothetical protein